MGTKGEEVMAEQGTAARLIEVATAELGTIEGPKDNETKYISEHNADFIDETGLIKLFQLNDEFLRPYMVSRCMYDILMASANTTTPLRYEVNYRNYFLVTQGQVRILLIPPKDTRYLYPINDYDILEFR